MGAVHIKILRKDVEETQTFQNMDNFIKKIASTRNQITAIASNVNIATNLGYEKWERQSNASWWSKAIVKELLNKKELDLKLGKKFSI